MLTDLSPTALARAVEANINAQLRLIYAHMPGVEVIDEPGLLGMMAGWSATLVNSAYWAAFPSGQVEAQIDAVLERFRGGRPMPREEKQHYHNVQKEAREWGSLHR